MAGERDGFLTSTVRSGEIFVGAYASQRERVFMWEGVTATATEGQTTYGCVLDGVCELETRRCRHRIAAGCFFSVAEPHAIEGGRGILIRVAGYAGITLVGGPVERTGRLRYIDGCTDTLLISPWRFGEPCLNALYFPPRVDQTAHTHPSVRMGAVLWGTGICRTASRTYLLQPGMPFCIPPEAVHSFHTTDDELAVLAYHPDSDFGPQDERHPMINRTMVAGVSASELPELRTR